MVSVIVPVYNVEPYLKKCVDSILSQDYKNLEIILVDDGSSDLCSDICDRYLFLDSRIQVIHKKNGGLSSARNSGLDVVSGNYIGFVDSDDYIAPEMYEKLYNALRLNHADIGICGYEQVNEEGKGFSVVSYSDALLTRQQAYEMLVQGNVYFAIICNKLFRSSIFTELRFPYGKIHEDEFVIHRLYGNADSVATISETYYKYLYRLTSIMGTVRHSVREFDGVEADIDRIMWFNSKGEHSFAARAVLQAISDYFIVINRKNIKDITYSIKAKEARKAITFCISQSRVNLLPKTTQMGLKAYQFGDLYYKVWRCILQFLQTIARRFDS